jgi:hypothetical protein
MKQAKTCLALFLGLSALHLQAATINPLDLVASTVGVFAPASASPSLTPATGRLFSAVLPGNIIYWRAASFTPSTTWDDLAAQTNQQASSAAGLVLDLRSNNSPEDFAGALHVASFLSKDQTDSTFAKAAFHGDVTALQGAPIVIVLVNRETRGAAESLASTLQAQGALVMGEATRGRHAVVPDVTTTADARDEAVSLALIDRQQVAQVISESATRHRLSEAALVQGQDPEQEAFIASHEQAEPASAASVPHDMALLEAIDSFKAIRVLQGEESSPQPRVADTSSNADRSAIASTGLR